VHFVLLKKYTAYIIRPKEIIPQINVPNLNLKNNFE
jgi:hypothetical protein